MSVSYRLDASGHLCPVPILMAERKIAELGPAQTLEVVFTDPGAKADFEAWCRANAHELLGFRLEKRSSSVYIRKK